MFNLRFVLTRIMFIMMSHVDLLVISPPSGFVGSIKPSLVVELTQRAVTEERLYRCLICDAITEWTYVADWLTPAGSLYQLAVKTHTRLQPNKLYSFPTQGTVSLISEPNRSALKVCNYFKFCIFVTVHGFV